MANRKFVAVYQKDIITAEGGTSCGFEGVVTVMPLDVLEKRYGPNGGGKVNIIEVSTNVDHLMETYVEKAIPTHTY